MVRAETKALGALILIGAASAIAYKVAGDSPGFAGFVAGAGTMYAWPAFVAGAREARERAVAPAW